MASSGIGSASSTTRFWGIPELVEMCFSNLAGEDGQETLARCAILSRSISELALERLWNSVSDLEPLFSLLPSSIDTHVPDDAYDPYGDSEITINYVS